MDTEKILSSLNRAKKSFKFYERREGKYQLASPILHEDGDMVDIYFQKSPKGAGYVRICDFGMALQRLSYNYEINTPSKKKVFNSILLNNGVQEDNGNLYLDAPVDKIYERVLQFAGCIQKVCGMDYWSREKTKTAFYENLKTFVLKDLKEFNPQPDVKPLLNNQMDNQKHAQKEISVFKADWSLKRKNRNFYLFGVPGSGKAKDSAKALLKFKEANLPFISLIAHEDMQNLGNKELIYLTKNADKQYPNLDDFNQEAARDIKRFAP